MTLPIVPRANELTTVFNRDKFDAPPGDVRDPADVARWQDFREKYHGAHRLEYEGAFPLQIDFELNSTCNLACGFCLHGNETVPRRELTIEQFTRVIEEGARHGLCSIKLNYINEPLIRKDLPTFIEIAKANGVLNVYFATNGTLLTQEMSKRLIKAGLSKLMISIDAATKETYEQLRASRMYHQVLSNLFGFLAVRDRFGVSYPLLRVNFLKLHENIHEAEPFLKLWYGVADMVAFQDQVALPGIESDLFHDEQTWHQFRCSFPFKLVVVDSAGEILPCCTMSGRSMSLGNIESTTIYDAWNSARATNLRALHQEGNWRTNAVCRHCVNGGVDG